MTVESVKANDTMLPVPADRILRFWFGEGDIQAGLKERLDFWFKGGEEIDKLIRAEFRADIERAANSEYSAWKETPRGRLALIILLDQFPRNASRGSGQSYAHDERAQQLCLEGLQQKADLQLDPFERLFLYLPLEHAEDLKLQELSVRKFQELLDEPAAEPKAAFKEFLDYAVRHHRVIARFGRFPHRNADLGRRSTPEELEFLSGPQAPF